MWHDTKDSPCYRELYKTHSSRIHIRNACLHLMHDTPQSTCRHVCSGTIDSERAGAGVITITSQKRQKSIQLGTFSTNSSFLVPALCSAQLTAENSPPENETDAKNKKSQKHKKKKKKNRLLFTLHTQLMLHVQSLDHSFSFHSLILPNHKSKSQNQSNSWDLKAQFSNRILISMGMWYNWINSSCGVGEGWYRLICFGFSGCCVSESSVSKLWK